MSTLARYLFALQLGIEHATSDYAREAALYNLRETAARIIAGADSDPLWRNK